MTAVRLAWDAAYVVVGAAIAAAVAWPLYETPRVAVIAAVGASVAVAVVLLARWRGWRFWRAVALTAAAFILLVVPLAVPSGLAAPERFVTALRDGVLGVVLGWKQLLTLAPPLGDYQAVLVPLLVVMLFGPMVALSVILRAPRRAGLAVVVVASMSVFGLAFGSGLTSPSLPLADGALLPAPRETALGVLLVAASLAWLVGRARFARSESLALAGATTGGVRQGPGSFWRTARRRVLAAAIVLVAVAGGLAVAPIAAAISPRQALREGIDPLLVVRDQPSPLAAYRSWFGSDAYDAELFTVTGDTTGIDRLRIATLDAYDGEVFEVGEGTRFTRLPSTSAAGGGLTVTIGDGFSGPWVPVPAGLTAAPTFQGARAAALTDGFYSGDADATAIDTASIGGATFGLTVGDSYRVHGAEVDAGDALATSRGGDPLLAVDAYPALVHWVESQEVPRTGAGLIDLVGRLTARGYLSHSLTDSATAQQWISDLSGRSPYAFQASYSGHSGARVEQLFTELTDQQGIVGSPADEDLLVAAVGDDEQFATAAALLGRYLGFESRVVVGVRLTAAADSPVEQCAAGVCTGANVTAWTEVRVPDGAWVPLDASPQFAQAPTMIAVGEQLPENATVPDQTSTDVVTPPTAQRDDSASTDAPTVPLPGWLETLLPLLARVGMGALAVALVLLPFAVLIAGKGIRRRLRRRAAIPEASVVGAWEELVDTYVDHGVDVRGNRTRSALAEQIGRPAARSLASAVDRAVFDESAPGRDLSAYAWTLVDGERRELRRASTRLERIRADLTPASFIRHLALPRTAWLLRTTALPRKDPA